MLKWASFREGKRGVFVVARLLFVDQSKEMLENYRSMFSASFEIICFSCQNRALSYASENPVDVLIVNSELGNQESGLQFLKRAGMSLSRTEGVLVTDQKSLNTGEVYGTQFPTFDKKSELFELFDYICSGYSEQKQKSRKNTESWRLTWTWLFKEKTGIRKQRV